MTAFVVVPCSAGKRPELSLPARERYTGTLHRLAMAAALALVDEDRVRIASAKYGLLCLDDLTVPYDLRIEALDRHDRLAWRSKMHCDACRMHKVDPDAEVIALVPALYVEAMRWSPMLARKIVDPLAGCGGIGGMRHRLAVIRDTGSIESFR